MKSALDNFVDTAFAVGGLTWIGIGLFYVMAKVSSDYSIFLLTR